MLAPADRNYSTATEYEVGAGFDENSTINTPPVLLESLLELLECAEELKQSEVRNYY